MNIDEVSSPDGVARYYDRNTGRFLRFGGAGDLAAIHRQVWAPGVNDTRQAFLYLNQVVTRAISPLCISNDRFLEVLDLGCGAGGTATWLAQQLHVRVIGLSNSRIQGRLASSRAARLGLAERCLFLQADFLAIPLPGPVGAAYAIEAFAHAVDPKRFFEQAATQLQSGGRLVVCDDFLSRREFPVPGADRWLRKFTEGWRLHSLLPVDTVKSLAFEAGFALLSSQELTPYIRHPNPVWLKLAGWLTHLPVSSAYWENLAGGTALNVCLSQGWTEYHTLVWEKL